MQNILGNITQLLPYKFQQQGYQVTESEDFIDVHYHGKQIGTFSTHNRDDLKEIIKLVENHSNNQVK